MHRKGRGRCEGRGVKPGTAERVKAIVQGSARGLSHREIAAQLGISTTAVDSLSAKYLVGDTPVAGCDALYDRWMNDHDIRGIGERAVEETG